MLGKEIYLISPRNSLIKVGLSEWHGRPRKKFPNTQSYKKYIKAKRSQPHEGGEEVTDALWEYSWPQDRVSKDLNL